VLASQAESRAFESRIPLQQIQALIDKFGKCLFCFNGGLPGGNIRHSQGCGTIAHGRMNGPLSFRVMPYCYGVESTEGRLLPEF
jgi:hypothetical protein